MWSLVFPRIGKLDINSYYGHLSVIIDNSDVEKFLNESNKQVFDWNFC